MELPAEVLVHNELVGMKGSRGVLLQVAPEGYYELNVQFGERTHRVMLPIATTVVISREPEQVVDAQALEIER